MDLNPLDMLQDGLDYVEDLLGTLKAWVYAQVDAITKSIGSLVQGLKDLAASVVTKISDAVTAVKVWVETRISLAIATAKAEIKKVTDAVGERVGAIETALKGALTAAKDAVASGVKAMGEAITALETKLTAQIVAVSKSVGDLMDTVTDPEKLLDLLAKTLDAVW